MDKDKIMFKGTHPDSLYRVSSAVTNENKFARAMRLLRWPIALLVVCVALAVFVYFLMPDSLDMDNESVNMTLWEAASIAGAARKAGKISSDKGNGGQFNNTAKQGTKTTEIDFYEDSDKNVDVKSLLENLGNTDTTKNLPIPPVFPSHISPEVQYGNDDNIRKPKIFNDQNDHNSVASSTFKPHITLKPEKPLAIYFKEKNAETISTETVEKSSTKDLIITDDDDDDDDDSAYSVVTDTHTKYHYETTKHELNTDPEPPPHVEASQSVKPNGKVNFTSGHSKLFGISLEEAEKYHPSTEGPLYNTRVSPTLPVWRDGDDSTTSKYPLEGQPQCRSTSLHLCRGILPYDLAMNDNVDINSQIPFIESLLATNCSDRIRHFICPIFEPECSAAPNPPRLPCYNLCKAVADSCASYITPSINYLFNCGNYPRDRCMTAGAPCNSNEFECDDNSCIPNEWTCDGNKDCPLGEDESLCRECRPDEFRCSRGECIQRQWLCDGYTDCTNAEDESPVNCVTQSYTPHQNEAGEELAGSAPAPSIRRLNDKLSNHRSAYPSRNADLESSKELLMTSDSTNALKRNYTRRPSLARLTPYSRIHKPTEIPKMANNIKELEDNSEIQNKTMNEDGKHLEKSEDLLSHLDKSIITLEKVLNIDFKKAAEEKSRNDEASKTGASAKSVTQDDYSQHLSQSAHASPCPEGELRCVDGRCITLTQLCDGTVDCTDHADEDNCYT